MINRKQIAAGSLTVLGFFTINAPAVADSSGVVPAEDVELCVTEVRNNADYSGARYVRHNIESSKRRTSGYSLDIETRVFGASGDTAVREYKAICVVRGGETPLVFSIKQKGNGG